MQVPQTLPACLTLITLFSGKLTQTENLKLAPIFVRVLQNLLAGVGNHPILRFPIYYALARVAGRAGQITLIFENITKFKQSFSVSNIGVEKFQSLLRLLHEGLLQSRQSELASSVMIELLATYTEENASQAREDAYKCIVSFLNDPNTFLMDHLLTLKPVKFLEGEPIHDLLTIFVTEKLSAYIAFYNSQKDFVDSLGLSHEQNLQKMRLLTFMQLAENKKELGFETIQKELQLQPDEVESFVIDVLRTKLVRAKVDQVNKRVLVSATMHRTFGRPQWQQLRETLAKWQVNLSQVQHTIQTAIRTQFQESLTA